MDPVSIISSMCTALGLLGGGAGFLIKRADARRERRETTVEGLLRERVAMLSNLHEQEKAGRAQDKADSTAVLEKERRAHSRMRATAGKWREQLIVNDITPEPANWPEAEDE